MTYYYIVIRHLIPLKEIKCNLCENDFVLHAESQNYILFDKLKVYRYNLNVLYNTVSHSYHLRRNVPKIRNI